MTQRSTVLVIGLVGLGLLAQAMPAFAQDFGRPDARDARAFEAPPEQPGHLVIRAALATITVEAEDRRDVAVSLVFLEEPDEDLPRVTPARLITGSGNRLFIDMSWNTSTDIALMVQVPRRLSLVIEGESGGTITVRGVAGAVEITSLNGDVMLEEISGSALVSTTNGDLHADFVTVDRDRPMSFVTTNGRIEMTFPTNLRAEVLMETSEAQYFSDFEIAQTEEAAGGVMGLRLRGTINGGGPLYRFKTHSEPIVLRRRSP